MVRLGDLGVVVLPERPGDLGDDLEQDVDPDGHVGRLHDRDLAPRIDHRRLLRLGQPGRPDNHRRPVVAGGVNPLQHALRDREVDHHVGYILGRVGHRHTERPHTGELADVGPDRLVPDGLDGGYDVELFRFDSQRGDPASHAPPRTGDGDPGHWRSFINRPSR